MASTDDSLRREINEIERALRRDDPTFLTQVRRLERADTVVVLTVFALLAAGSVLLTIGAATASVAACSLALAAMFAACLISRRHEQTLRRSPGEKPHPDRVDPSPGHGDANRGG